MLLVNISRKASVLQGYQLLTVGDMTTALAYLSSRGYTGNVSCYRNGPTLVWQITLQLDAATSVATGFINDWIVIENDSIATIVPAAKAAAMYQVT